MPRKISNSVHRYFNWDASAKYSTCKDCGNKLKGNHASNLLNHLRLKHQEKHNEVLNINNGTSKVIVTRNKKDEEKEIKRKKLLECCIKLVAVHGRPFELLEDKAFRELKSLISSDFLEEANSKKIRKLITEKAIKIKEKISAEIKHKLVSIKMDSATCMDRQFIGINVQYVKNSEIVVRNLALVEIFFSQTAENLKLTLLDVLLDFQINLCNVYSLTTDNGANYLKISKLLNQGTDNQTDDNDSDVEVEDYNFDFETGLDSFDATFLNENIAQRNSFEIRSIACAVHTLQLCVKDALKKDHDHEFVIEVSRSAVRILRRPLMKLKIKNEKLRKPILDCTTRWSSTYYMLIRLKELRTICDDCGEIAELINENIWTKINDILDALKPFEEATLRLQTEQLTIGDFYSIWIICKTKTQKNHSSLARELVLSMTEREKTLLSSKAFLMGIFMDPRLKLILSEQEKETAKGWIKEVHQQLRAVQVNEHNPESCSQNPPAALDLPGSSHDDPIISNPADNFTSDLQNLDLILEETQTVRSSGSMTLDFDYYLAEYLTVPRLAVTENALKYWSSKLPHMLADLALIVLAAPATQVTVERLFSVLKFILTPSRNRLLDQTLKHIVLIKTNQDLFND